MRKISAPTTGIGLSCSIPWVWWLSDSRASYGILRGSTHQTTPIEDMQSRTCIQHEQDFSATVSRSAVALDVASQLEGLVAKALHHLGLREVRLVQ